MALDSGEQFAGALGELKQCGAAAVLGEVVAVGQAGGQAGGWWVIRESKGQLKEGSRRGAAGVQGFEGCLRS